MSVKQQMNLNVKLHKIFDSCQLQGKWKHKTNSLNPHEYIALEEGAVIVLNLDAGLTETFSFKKGSNISIKESLVEYYDSDLMR